jgi:hypothetical protein
VALVHSQAEVLTAMKDPYRVKAMAFLEKIGIELIMNDRVKEVIKGPSEQQQQQKQPGEQSEEEEEAIVPGGDSLLLASGKRIPCDLFIPAYPTGGNGATFLPTTSVDSRGYVIVDDCFRVKGFSRGNILAGGDCSNFYADKSFMKIYDIMPSFVRNIELFFQGKVLKEHLRNRSFWAQIDGPMFVAFGHGLWWEGYGVGPNLPNCWGQLVWFFGCCCSTPAGRLAGIIKSIFNDSIVPKKGKGISS